MTGIVSEHLTQKLTEDIRTRGLLVWLDGDGAYTDFVDRLSDGAGGGSKQSTNGFPYPVFAFRGSFVRLMRESYPKLAGAQLPRCVIHLPGFSEDSIKSTPLYEAYKAGSRWRVALETIVREVAQGHLTPQQLDVLLEREDLSLEVADHILAGHVEVTPELRALLTHYGEDGLIVKLVTEPQALVAEFDGDETALIESLLHRLERHLGMDQEWIAAWSGQVLGIDSLSDALWGFLLCREYAADLVEKPASRRLLRLRQLSKEYHRSGGRILAVLRQSHADMYVIRAEEIASALQESETTVSPAMLGTIDTFRFEAEVFLAEAFRLLDQRQWSQAGELARIRYGGESGGNPSFWVGRDRNLGQAWKWVTIAAALGGALAADAMTGSTVEATKVDSSFDVSGETTKYLESRWSIDRLHRKFTLESANIGAVGLDTHMSTFSRVRSTVVQRYRTWIDTTSRVWNAVCERDGFLPETTVRQRTFFARFVAPALRTGAKTAVVLADAFRYELGVELKDRLSQEDLGTIDLSAMLAELPTITAVGMSALAPTGDGNELVPVFSTDGAKISGFRGGSRDVTTPAAREKTFADVSGVTCGWQNLNTFLSLDEKKAKRVGDHQLLIIATDTVDAEGEGDALSAGINYFDPAISRIMIAVRLLMKLGYQRIVITADHGFIIGDDGVQTGRATQLPGVNRRYAVGEARFGEELVSVRLPELQYRTEQAQKAIIFDRTSHLLSARAGGSFYHGGNSPQERIIPVLTITAGKAGHREPGHYRFAYETLPDVLGTHRIRITATETSVAALFEKEPLDVRVVADESVVVTVADVSGGHQQGDIVRLEVGSPCEIYFTLHGSTPRSRLWFVSARPDNTIENGESPEYFDVEVKTTTGTETATVSDTPAPASDAWPEFIDEIYHPALHHLKTHGALSERYLTNTLGGGSVGSRKARRFALKLDDWRPYLPFHVTVHETAEGKEYRTS